MKRKVTLTLLVAAAALTAIGVAVAGGQSNQAAGAAATLRGSVGPGFTISLKRNGKKVTRIKPGTYRVVVADRSSEHNFVLKRTGGPIRELTTVGFTGTRTVNVRLTNGRWEFYCAPHEPVMRGFVTVGAATAPTAASKAATTTTTTTVADDDDDRGRGEAEPGDDHGGRGEAEPGDDHGGHGEGEPGDDHSGHGGGGDD